MAGELFPPEPTKGVASAVSAAATAEPDIVEVLVGAGVADLQLATPALVLVAKRVRVSRRALVGVCIVVGFGVRFCGFSCDLYDS